MPHQKKATWNFSINLSAFRIFSSVNISHEFPCNFGATFEEKTNFRYSFTGRIFKLHFCWGILCCDSNERTHWTNTHSYIAKCYTSFHSCQSVDRLFSFPYIVNKGKIATHLFMILNSFTVASYVLNTISRCANVIAQCD